MHQETFQKRIFPLRHRFYRLALRITGHSGEAEDVVQDTLVKIWEQRRQWSSVSNLEAWCLRLVRNRSIDQTRSKHRRMAEMPEGLEPSETQDSPHETLIRAEVRDHIEAFIASLPEKQGLVIHLRDLEGMSYQEIADALELSLEQVKVYLHRSRKKLRTYLLNSDVYGVPKH